MRRRGGHLTRRRLIGATVFSIMGRKGLGSPAGSCAGRRLPPERREFRDDRTDTVLWQMTAAPSMHHHFYFTNPSWPDDQRELYFISYRGGYPNIFAATAHDGSITQLTDRPDINPFSPAATRDGERIYFSARDAVIELDRATLRERTLATFGGARLGNCSLNPRGSRLAIGVRSETSCRLALVDVELTFDPSWTPDKMSDAARAKFGW